MKKFIILFCTVTLFGCDKPNIKSDGAPLIISNGSIEKIQNYYKKHLVSYDIELSLQSTNNGSFKNAGNSINGYEQLTITGSVNTQKFSDTEIKQNVFNIGTYILSFDEKYGFIRTTSKGLSQDNLIVDIFNTKSLPVGIHNSKNAKLNKTEITTPLLIPKPIYFTYPNISYAEKVMTTNNQLLIKWNADVENKNGIVIMLSWHGESASGTRKYEDKDLKVIKFVEDDGNEIIDNSMLQYFPNDAFVDIAIGRGFIEESNIDGYTAKLESLTYAYEHFGVIKK